MFPGQEPWAFGVEVEEASRDLIRERYELMPYLYGTFEESTRTGAPILRPMFWEFGAGFADVVDQAMLGPALMVAPMLAEGATSRSVRFPAGRWIQARSGLITLGPATLETAATWGAVPIWVREGSIVPTTEAGPTVGPDDRLRLDLYPGPTASRATYYEDDGDGFENTARVDYRMTPTATGLELTAHPRVGARAARPMIVRLVRADLGASAVTLDGAALPERATVAELEQGGWFRDPNDRSVLIGVPRRDAFQLRIDYDPTIADQGPPVDVRFTVTVPAGTPADPPVHVATSINGWAHVPLAWTSATTAELTLSVPRGSPIGYKYTRGGWETVEKTASCAERGDRQRIAASSARADVVAAFVDRCP